MIYDYVVIGAGVSGLAFANQVRATQPEATVLVLEREAEAGGYCRTVVQDGFVWDYSGHFFHFKNPEIEAWLRARMPGQEVRIVNKQSKIRYGGADIEFPFQRNIHQLPQAEFIACLVDLYEASKRGPGDPPTSFLAMLHARFGRAITEKFLAPYNQKLYACDLDTLDPDAMGRFFPQASFADVMNNLRDASQNDRGYNAMFSYPVGGAMQYIHALLHDLPAATVALNERVTGVQLAAHTVTTSQRTVGYRHLVSSAPMPVLAAIAGQAAELASAVFTANQVMVFNLGFDRKGQRDIHWMYFPEPQFCFYRVGWYDNILASDRMSLYVEIGAPAGSHVDVEVARQHVLRDLARASIVTDQQLVAWHSVTMNPAYCHISQQSMAAVARLRATLGGYDVHSIGRYGGWTYCSIEDNIVEARGLADALR
ncbi:MAG: FAD-dependent oxidoreductase [Kofleriaceae bacterium]|nr:FAD-dependent oxidoreductase [Kofleriaceae bacterium]